MQADQSSGTCTPKRLLASPSHPVTKGLGIMCGKQGHSGGRGFARSQPLRIQGSRSKLHCKDRPKWRRDQRNRGIEMDRYQTAG
jgi:hypothetical protein